MSDDHDTPNMMMGEFMADEMARMREDTGAHPAQQPQYGALQKQITKLQNTETAVLATLRVIGFLASVFAVSALSGIVWAGSSIVTMQARLDSIESRIENHAREGHPHTTANVAEVRSESRELRAETAARLRNIERQLSEIRDAVLDNRSNRTRR